MPKYALDSVHTNTSRATYRLASICGRNQARHQSGMQQFHSIIKKIYLESP